MLLIPMSFQTHVGSDGPGFVDVLSSLRQTGNRRCDMCNGRFGLVRHRFGWKQFCCKACLDNYLSRTTHEAVSLQELARVFGSQGMTHARSVEYSVGPATCNRATGSALTAMTSTAEEKAFLRVAVAAIPRVTEIIQGFSRNDQAGALETAERSFLAAALDYGCTEIAAQSRVSALMRRLRSRLERQQAGEKKLQALLHRLTEPD